LKWSFLVLPVNRKPKKGGSRRKGGVSGFHTSRKTLSGKKELGRTWKKTNFCKKKTFRRGVKLLAEKVSLILTLTER